MTFEQTRTYIKGVLKKPKLCKIDNPIEECDDFATFWDEGDNYEAEE